MAKKGLKYPFKIQTASSKKKKVYQTDFVTLKPLFFFFFYTKSIRAWVLSLVVTYRN